MTRNDETNNATTVYVGKLLLLVGSGKFRNLAVVNSRTSCGRGPVETPEKAYAKAKPQFVAPAMLSGEGQLAMPAST